MGLTEFFQSSCTNVSQIIEFSTDFEFDYYLNPVALTLCYYILTFTSAFLLNPKVGTRS